MPLDEGARARASAFTDRAQRWPLWRIACGSALALGAGAGAALVGHQVLAAGCALVLALASGAVGWLFGEHHRKALEQEIGDRSADLHRALSELEIAQAETVRRLSMAVEFRDEDTGAHIERIGRFSTMLSEQIGMEEEFSARMVHAAPLHDVGKVAIPDAILLKPGQLTPEERAIVETHAEEGHRLLKGSTSAILDLAATIALSHHEKWDGSGYPRGLKGEMIPIEGRIVAIADVFDALTSDRVYRKAYPVEEAVAMMRAERGLHFDPVLLDAFLEVLAGSGPDAREQVKADPTAVFDAALDTFVTGLQRGDAELAEGAVAQAIEDGVVAAELPGEVIEPALRRLAELRDQGEIDADRERTAIEIARRVLATLRRYVLARETEPEALQKVDSSIDHVESLLGRVADAEAGVAGR
ncbi:MAG TPA: HD domain-containing phosphohydrolase [Solirubrobacteraceae bacterium]|nr:HD domain-containing phosphohydrolase [Solirubrobacteraceae bacterium]